MLQLYSEKDRSDIERKLLASIIEYSSDAIISKTLQSIVTSWNPGAEKIFGYSAQEMIGNSITILIPNERLHEETAILAKIEQGERVKPFKTIRIKKNKERICVSVCVSPIKDSKGVIIGASKIARDISHEIKNQEMQLLLSSLINSSDDAIISKNLKGIITSWNPAAEKMFGYSAQEIVGKSILLLFPPDRFEEESLIQKKIVAGEKIEHFETVRIKKDGNRIPIIASISPIKNAEGLIVGASKIARDITELTLQRYLASHDTLTSLPTVRLAYDRLEAICQKTQDKGNRFAVLFIDLDGFKNINDSYGHDTGNFVLKIIAERLKSCLRDYDIVARIGGDEFLIILDKINTSQDVIGITEKIVISTSSPIQYNQQSLKIGVSVGIAMFPDHGKNKEELLHKADKAMYWVKRSGKSSFSFYSNAM